MSVPGGRRMTLGRRRLQDNGDVARMRQTGSDVRPVGKGFLRSRPAWSRDGARFVFSCPATALVTPASAGLEVAR
jgi:hypothetical protein